MRYPCCECCFGLVNRDGYETCLLEPHLEPCEACQLLPESEFWKELG